MKLYHRFFKLAIFEGYTIFYCRLSFELDYKING